MGGNEADSVDGHSVADHPQRPVQAKVMRAPSVARPGSVKANASSKGNTQKYADIRRKLEEKKRQEAAMAAARARSRRGPVQETAELATDTVGSAVAVTEDVTEDAVGLVEEVVDDAASLAQAALRAVEETGQAAARAVVGAARVVTAPLTGGSAYPLADDYEEPVASTRYSGGGAQRVSQKKKKGRKPSASKDPSLWTRTLSSTAPSEPNGQVKFLDAPLSEVSLNEEGSLAPGESMSVTFTPAMITNSLVHFYGSRNIEVDQFTVAIEYLNRAFVRSITVNVTSSNGKSDAVVALSVRQGDRSGTSLWPERIIHTSETAATQSALEEGHITDPFKFALTSRELASDARVKLRASDRATSSQIMREINLKHHMNPQNDITMATLSANSTVAALVQADDNVTDVKKNSDGTITVADRAVSGAIGTVVATRRKLSNYVDLTKGLVVEIRRPATAFSSDIASVRMTMSVRAAFVVVGEVLA